MGPPNAKRATRAWGPGDALNQNTVGAMVKVPSKDSRNSIRFQSVVRHLHALGPRAMGEFLDDMVRKGAGDRASMLALLESYGHVSPAVFHALGCRDFPRPPLTGVV